MSTLSELIKKSRRERGWTQSFLAEKLGVSVQAVSQWERGSSKPTTDRFTELAALLDINPADLFGEGLRGSMLAGRDAPIVDLDKPDLSNLKTAKASRDSCDIRWEPKGDAFAIVIGRDRSMLPTFNPHDLVIFDTGLTPEPGEFVVAQVEDLTVFRRLRVRANPGEPDILELVPVNPDFPTIVLERSPFNRIVGVMMEHRIPSPRLQKYR